MDVLKRAHVTLLVLAAVSGCARPASGVFNHHAFYDAQRNYRIRYLPADDQARRTLPEGWRIENFTQNAAGAPIDVRRNPVFHTAFQMRFLHPRLGSHPAIGYPRYDVLYERGGDDGSAIYARTIMLPLAWAEVPVSELVRQGVASLVDNRPAPDVWGFARPAAGSEITVRGEAVAAIDDQEGFSTTFDVSAAGHPSIRATVVAVRTEVAVRSRRTVRLPALVIFGHVATVEMHELETETFAAWLARVDFAPREAPHREPGRI